MTSVAEMRAWVLLALHELGGWARRRDVLDVIERRCGHEMDVEDREPVGPDRELRWRNRASTARNWLIDAGMLCPLKTVGRGVWMLTGLGAEEAARLASLAVPSLCPSFRAIAADVDWRTRTGRSLRMVSRETTFTDNALLQLANDHRTHIAIRQFAAQQEARNGADWEWWMRDGNGYAGFRVQAK